MAIEAKVLAEGQVANSKGTIFTATAISYVKTINFFNTNAAAQTIQVWLKPGATSRQLLYVSGVAQYERLEIDLSISLESGDLIEAATTTASAVDFIVTGGAVV